MNETNEKLIESQRKARAENAKKIIEETSKSHENNVKVATPKVVPKKITVEIEPVAAPEKHKISKTDIIITTIFVIAGFFLALLIKPEVIDDFKRILK